MPDQKPYDPDVIELPKKEEPTAEPAGDETPDYIFRAQVAFTSFLPPNGRYIGGTAGVGLAGVLVWGLWTMWQERAATAQFADIAAVDYKMPKPDPMAQYGIGPADDPTDLGRTEDLKEGARRFEAAAKASSGSAAVYGYLKAAAAWERAGDGTARLAALKAASEVRAGDLPAWGASSAYAAALVDVDRSEEAIGVYRELAGSTQGFYAQQALLSLAATQLDLGKIEDAKHTIAEFKTLFPTAPMERVLALEARATGPVTSGGPG